MATGKKIKHNKRITISFGMLLFHEIHNLHEVYKIINSIQMFKITNKIQKITAKVIRNYQN